MVTTLLRTPLHSEHVALNAKLAPFCGWEMPIQYEGVLVEHNEVRSRCGIFDVSHMGRIEIQGQDAEKFLDYLVTNRIQGKAVGSCTYALLATADGKGVHDDLIVYRLGPENFFIVVNAANREQDLAYIQSMQEGFDCRIRPCFHEEGILALQGPLAATFLGQLFPKIDQLKRFQCGVFTYDNRSLLISRTGYTGEDGFEIMVENDLLAPLWRYFTRCGVMPIGLGARNTLRLEMGYALHGNDIGYDIAASESVARFAVRLNKERFIGKEGLMAYESCRRYPVAIVLEKGIAREGSPIFLNGKRIGQVTSGAFSPSVKRGVALGLVQEKLDMKVSLEVEVRQKMLTATVVSLPFYKH